MTAREAKRRVCAFAALDLARVDDGAALYDGLGSEDANRVADALAELVSELERRGGDSWQPGDGANKPPKRGPQPAVVVNPGTVVK